MRTLTAEAFHETVNYCFDKTLNLMGSQVREAVYNQLHAKNLSETEISTRLDDVFKVLSDSFGGSSRIIIYKMLCELCQQYQIRIDFTYQDQLKDQYLVIQNKVFSDHLLPKKVRGEDQGAFHAYSTIVQASRIQK
jgi:hypothetical protein